VTESKILTGSVDGKIREYDLRAGQLTLDTLGEATTSVTYTRDGQCVVASCADATVRLIDTHAGELLNEFKGHTTKDYCVETVTGYKNSNMKNIFSSKMQFMCVQVLETPPFCADLLTAVSGCGTLSALKLSESYCTVLAPLSCPR
jgi:WD40 repeat protein